MLNYQRDPEGIWKIKFMFQTTNQFGVTAIMINWQIDRKVTKNHVFDGCLLNWRGILFGNTQGHSRIHKWLSWLLPFGKHTKIWEITIFNGYINYKWQFSIAMLNYQRVLPVTFESCIVLFLSSIA